MQRTSGTIMISAFLLMFAFNAQDAHAIIRAEILEGYKAALKPAYNDPSLNPAVTAICQLIARRVHPILPDTSQLDYDLDEKQNEYFEKIAIQLDLDRKTRGLVAWRIFRDACKAEVGNYEEPARRNSWRRDRWSAWETEQETAQRVASEERFKAGFTAEELRERSMFGMYPEVDPERRKK